MKKNYTMTLEIVSPEEIDLHEVNELLNGKGSFVNTEDNLWKVSCSDSDTFLKALEMICCYSCGYSAEDYEDMKNNPDKYFDTEIAA